MRKSLILLIAAFGLVACAPQRTLTIVHVNDTHSHFEPVRQSDGSLAGGILERAAFIDSVRRADGPGNVLFLHAGDFCQGSSYYTELGGAMEIDLINALGYDAVALGNHEFDNGLEDLARRLSRCQAPVVCANYDFSTFELGRHVHPYTIVEKAGRRIGIIGLLTDLSSVVDRDIVDRMPYLDPVEAVNRYAALLRDEEGCDLVICLTHIGYRTSDNYEEDGELMDQDLVAATRGVDLVVGGHSHTFLEAMQYADNLDGVPVPIVQDGCWGLYTGILHLAR